MAGTTTHPITYSEFATKVQPLDWNAAWTATDVKFVPYTGANADVDLGTYDFTTTGNVTTEKVIFNGAGEFELTADGQTILHDNYASIYVWGSVVDVNADWNAAIADGSYIGQLLTVHLKATAQDTNVFGAYLKITLTAPERAIYINAGVLATKSVSNNFNLIWDGTDWKSVDGLTNNDWTGGEGAWASGLNTTASARSSHAEGLATTASGIASHAEGSATTANQPYAHAEGYVTTASGTFGSHAQGRDSVASGDSSHAGGRNSLSSGDYSFASGYYPTSSGSQSISFGNNTIASGTGARAYGVLTTAEGDRAHTNGYYMKATGRDTVLFGFNATEVTYAQDYHFILHGLDFLSDSDMTTTGRVTCGDFTYDGTGTIAVTIEEIPLIGGVITIPELVMTSSLGVVYGSIRDTLYMRASGSAASLYFSNSDGTASSQIRYTVADDTLDFLTATGGYTFFNGDVTIKESLLIGATIDHSIYDDSDDLIIENPNSNADFYLNINDGGVTRDIMWVDSSLSMVQLHANRLRLTSSLTDNTNKYGYLTTKHYDNEEQDTLMFMGGAGTIRFGGGSGSYNAASQVRFYTAANNTTLTGTQRWTINSSGDLLSGSDGTGVYDITTAGNITLALDNAQLQMGNAGATDYYQTFDGTNPIFYTSGDYQFTNGNFLVSGKSSQDAIFELWADRGDNYSDKWRFVAVDSATSGNLEIDSFTSGAYVNKLTLTTDGNLKTTAGRIVNTTRVTTTYQALVTDHTIYCDTDGGAFTLTLPAGVEGQHLRITNCGSGGLTLTIDGNGTETVMGELTQELSDGDTLNMYYNATEGWW